MDRQRNRRRTQEAWGRDRNLASARSQTAQKRGFQPHRFRYWLSKEEDPYREEKIMEGCQVYAQAAERAKEGERTISMDELTGVQALERKHSDLPLLAGHVLRREFEYIRHGTLSWYFNLDVATGQMIEPSWGPSRGEQDCLAHLKRLVASAPEVKRWHLMMDNLDTHRSEALVRWVAELLARCDASGGVLLHPQTCLLDESGGNLAQYSGTQAAQARQFYLA
jgi:hypothetical protein